MCKKTDLLDSLLKALLLKIASYYETNHLQFCKETWIKSSFAVNPDVPLAQFYSHVQCFFHGAGTGWPQGQEQAVIPGLPVSWWTGSSSWVRSLSLGSTQDTLQPCQSALGAEFRALEVCM